MRNLINFFNKMPNYRFLLNYLLMISLSRIYKVRAIGCAKIIARATQ